MLRFVGAGFGDDEEVSVKLEDETSVPAVQESIPEPVEEEEAPVDILGGGSFSFKRPESVIEIYDAPEPELEPEPAAQPAAFVARQKSSSSSKKSKKSSKKEPNEKREAVTDGYPLVGLERELYEIEKVFESVKVQDKHNIFENPITDAVVPNYSKVIKRPMCFADIKKGLQEKTYTSLEAVKADIELVFTNAITFNPPLHWVHKTAVAVRASFHQKLVRFHKRLAKLADIDRKQNDGMDLRHIGPFETRWYKQNAKMLEETLLNNTTANVMNSWLVSLMTTTRPDASTFCTDPCLLLPDYRARVAHPMHLMLVAQNLRDLKYENVLQLVEDVHLVFENCAQYWGMDSTWTGTAKKLAKKFNNMVKATFDDGELDPGQRLLLKAVLPGPRSPISFKQAIPKIEQKPVEPIMMEVKKPARPRPKRYTEEENLEYLLEKVNVLLNDPQMKWYSYDFDPEAEGLLGYHDIIKRKMDMGTVEERLRDKYYTDVAAALEEMKLVFSNAITYYDPPRWERKDWETTKAVMWIVAKLYYNKMNLLELEMRARAVETIPPRDQKRWEKIALSILNTLMKQKEYILFIQPVNPLAFRLPRYFEVVKKPMDLETVKSTLLYGAYETFDDFDDAVKQIIYNCRLYYPEKQNEILRPARMLENEFEHLVKQHKHQLVDAEDEQAFFHPESFHSLVPPQPLSVSAPERDIDILNVQSSNALMMKKKKKKSMSSSVAASAFTGFPASLDAFSSPQIAAAPSGPIMRRPTKLVRVASLTAFNKKDRRLALTPAQRNKLKNQVNEEFVLAPGPPREIKQTKKNGSILRPSDSSVGIVHAISEEDIETMDLDMEEFVEDDVQIFLSRKRKVPDIDADTIARATELVAAEKDTKVHDEFVVPVYPSLYSDKPKNFWPVESPSSDANILVYAKRVMLSTAVTKSGQPRLEHFMVLLTGNASEMPQPVVHSESKEDWLTETQRKSKQKAQKVTGKPLSDDTNVEFEASNFNKKAFLAMRAGRKKGIEKIQFNVKRTAQPLRPSQSSMFNRLRGQQPSNQPEPSPSEVVPTVFIRPPSPESEGEYEDIEDTDVLLPPGKTIWDLREVHNTFPSKLLSTADFATIESGSDSEQPGDDDAMADEEPLQDTKSGDVASEEYDEDENIQHPAIWPTPVRLACGVEVEAAANDVQYLQSLYNDSRNYTFDTSDEESFHSLQLSDADLNAIGRRNTISLDGFSCQLQELTWHDAGFLVATQTLAFDESPLCVPLTVLHFVAVEKSLALTIQGQPLEWLTPDILVPKKAHAEAAQLLVSVTSKRLLNRLASMKPLLSKLEKESADDDVRNEPLPSPVQVQARKRRRRKTKY